MKLKRFFIERRKAEAEANAKLVEVLRDQDTEEKCPLTKAELIMALQTQRTTVAQPRRLPALAAAAACLTLLAVALMVYFLPREKAHQASTGPKHKPTLIVRQPAPRLVDRPEDSNKAQLMTAEKPVSTPQRKMAAKRYHFYKEPKHSSSPYRKVAESLEEKIASNKAEPEKQPEIIPEASQQKPELIIVAPEERVIDVVRDDSYSNSNSYVIRYVSADDAAAGVPL